jgi:hypothetical protein
MSKIRRGGLCPAQVLGDDSKIANVPVFMAPVFLAKAIDCLGFGKHGILYPYGNVPCV